MEKEIEVALEQLNTVGNILLWGAGYHTDEVLKFYKSFFNRKNFWITDKYKTGKSVVGYRILAPNEINYASIDLVVITSSVYHDEIENALRYEYGYHGSVMEVNLFRYALLEIDSYDECRYHLEDFIHHMESGRESYSYDSVFKEKFAHYKKIKMFAWWGSCIGETIRYLLAYYDSVFRNKPEDEYYLLVPYIKGNDFANGKLIEIVSRVIPMVTYDNCHFWEYLSRKYPEHFDCKFYNDYSGIFVDAFNQFDKRIPNACFRDAKFSIISYTPEEEKEAADKLKEMGVSREFICIFARDNAYVQHQYNNGEYSLHTNRNMEIESFESVEDYMSEKRIQTIRMGKMVNRPVALMNCIDYATKYQDDLMDLYLLGKCKFYAGSLSGITAIAQMQGVPTVLLGVVQIAAHNSLPFRSDDIYVPKKLYSKKNKRILSFTEMWDVEIAAKDYMTQYCQEQELEFIECSQEEIRDAIIEMNEKIDGTYVEDEYEMGLQKKYHELLDNWIERKGYHHFYFWEGNISGSFIKKNAYLLEESTKRIMANE